MLHFTFKTISLLSETSMSSITRHLPNNIETVLHREQQTSFTQRLPASILTPVITWMHSVRTEPLWSASIVHCGVLNSSCKAQREKAEQGVRSLKIASGQRELKREKRLSGATPPQHWTLLSHSLLMFLYAVQSGGRDILPLGRHYKRVIWLHSCLPLANFVFFYIPDRWFWFPPTATQSASTQWWVHTGSTGDREWHIHTMSNTRESCREAQERLGNSHQRQNTHNKKVIYCILKVCYFGVKVKKKRAAFLIMDPWIPRIAS